MIPSSFTAGSTFSATETFTDYPASDGWTAKMVAQLGSTKIQLISTASGDDHAFAATASATGAWSAGKFQLFVFVEKDSERHLARGPVDFEVWPDPAGAGAALSALEEQLAAVDAAITAVIAGKGVQSYTFETQAGRRSAERMSLQELRAHRGWLSDRVEQERARQQGRKPRGGWRRVRTKFSR